MDRKLRSSRAQEDRGAKRHGGRLQPGSGSGRYVSLPLYKRGGLVVAYAWVDEDDFDRVQSEGTWYLGSKNNVQRSRTVEGVQQTVRLHRFILGVTDPKVQVDHIDFNRLNNTKSNLRVCTNLQNCQNNKARKNGTSQYRGVSWHVPTQKWIAQATINYKKHHVGLFDSEELAHEAVVAWRLKRMPFTVENSGS